MTWPLYPQERSSTHCVGGWLGPRASLDGAESMYVKEWFKPIFPLILTSLPHKVPYPHCWFWCVVGDCLPPHTIQCTPHRYRIHLDHGRIDVCTQRIITWHVKLFTILKAHHIVSVLSTYIIFMYIILTTSCKILPYWYNIYILPKLSSACYLARTMYPHCKSNTLKMIYFTCFHAVMECGIIFWGDSVESKRIFQKQKRIIRIMTGSSSRISCRTLFQKLQMLTLTSQNILSLMRFLSSNLEIYKFNP